MGSTGGFDTFCADGVVCGHAKFQDTNGGFDCSECCEYLMSSELVKTKIIKTCRNTLLRNVDKLWNGFYFKLIDSKQII